VSLWFDEKDVCLRHREVVCPSCLTYERNYYRALADELAAALRKTSDRIDMDDDTPCWCVPWMAGHNPTCREARAVLARYDAARGKVGG
jgi:hypothetical protein